MTDRIPNLYAFSRTYEAGTAVRDIMHVHGVEDMTWKSDDLFKDGEGRTVILGFWWRGYVEDETKLATVRAALDEAGHPWFREPDKVGAAT